MKVGKAMRALEFAKLGISTWSDVGLLNKLKELKRKKSKDKKNQDFKDLFIKIIEEELNKRGKK